MKQYLLLAIFGFCLMSCISDDKEATFRGESMAIARAKNLCNASKEDMRWLEDLIKEMETDVTLKGSIYGILTSRGAVFVHQPFIMSCLACVCYDCDGNRMPPPTHLSEEILKGMKLENMIYQPSM